MATLEELFETQQVDTPPSSLRGILQTKDYREFIILSDTGDLLHTFTGAIFANKCLPGDHVEWRDDRCHLELRDEHPPLVGTLELTSKARYGLTSRGIPMYLFTPYSKSYPPLIVGCSEKDTSCNRIALVTLDTWTKMFPRGHLKTILGVSGEYEAEKTALIWQACPYVYPKYDYQPTATSATTTKNTLAGYTFHIDPPGCRDVDDVFTFEEIEEGQWKVTITISDVAHYVAEDSPIDIMASLIGQSLYDTTGTVLRPMLPPAYSEDACSLLPGKLCHGVSLQFVWDGAIHDCQWLESTVIVYQSYTYDEFQASSSLYRPVLAAIASYLAETEVTCAHGWVEQMMIFYNKQAGSILQRVGQGILRKHSAPNMKRLHTYQQHLSHVANIQALAYSSATYCLADETDAAHYGLQSAHYAHASSPIRRYADLINQRVLKNYIQQTEVRFIVPQAMYDMNRREKAIKHFARDMEFLTAITQPTSVVRAIILEKIKQGDQMKIRLYVPVWRRTISTQYRYMSENCALSRDEMREIDVTDFTEVQLEYACQINARNWKERIIISIVPLSFASSVDKGTLVDEGTLVHA